MKEDRVGKGRRARGWEDARGARTSGTQLDERGKTQLDERGKTRLDERGKTRLGAARFDCD